MFTRPIQHINDTCANCHAPDVIDEINKCYNELRDKIMTKIQSTQSWEKVAVLHRVLEEAHSQRCKELRSADKLRDNGFVLWGPAGEEGDDGCGLFRMENDRV